MLVQHDEQVIDLIHKGVYAFAAGALADGLVGGPARVLRPRAGWTPAGQVPGRAAEH